MKTTKEELIEEAIRDIDRIRLLPGYVAKILDKEDSPRIEELTAKLIPRAEAFAEKMKDNTTFTHFSHTRPSDMVDNNSWKVYCLVNHMGLFYEFIKDRPQMTLEFFDVIGWAQIQTFPNNIHKQHIARIGFALLEEERGKGYGSMMVDFILRRTHNYRKIVASVYEDNASMLHIYHKRGFVDEGIFLKEEEWNGKFRTVLSLAKFNESQSV